MFSITLPKPRAVPQFPSSPVQQTPRIKLRTVVLQTGNAETREDNLPT